MIKHFKIPFNYFGSQNFAIFVEAVDNFGICLFLLDAYCKGESSRQGYYSIGFATNLDVLLLETLQFMLSCSACTKSLESSLRE